MGQRRAGTDLTAAAARGPHQGIRRQGDRRGNTPDAKNDEKSDDDKAEAPPPEINDNNFDGMMGRGRDGPEKKFRIGLRQGENEIVVKVVFGGGASPERPVAASRRQRAKATWAAVLVVAARSHSRSRRRATTC